MSHSDSHTAPQPVFDEPWHAQIFAMTVALNEAGRLGWSDWAARFSATLQRYRLDRELNGGDDYFHAWLDTLEQLLSEQGATQVGELADVSAAWREAYLTTPHGQPVVLPDLS